jgi:hypothetical protein
MIFVSNPPWPKREAALGGSVIHLEEGGALGMVEAPLEGRDPSGGPPHPKVPLLHLSYAMPEAHTQ